MNYCGQCGAANDSANQVCSRCGTPVAVEEAVAASTGQRQAASAFARASDAGTVPLVADLNIPEWLKTAAAATPHDPHAQSSDTAFPPVGFVVDEAAKPSGSIKSDQAEPNTPQELISQPRGNGPAPIAEWMRTGAHTNASTPQQPPIDATDTTSFISESDLPDWIRQIANADATKRAEEQRLATEAARAAAPDAAAAKKLPLPGETPTAGHATNPWLSRRDASSATEAWSTPTSRAVPVETPQVAEQLAIAAPESEMVAPVPVARVSEPTVKRRGKLSVPSVTRPSMGKASIPKATSSKKSLPKLALPSIGSGLNQSTMRIALIGVIALLFIIVLATQLL